ncbi:MAG: 4-(cytidine 5'-diphospho)-2-C-methyl-D-erythritol kinase [Sulfurovum sp.]|nr:4-(cytidine 5'-diphospho)-2-C-methyl-D-erythritol kinase [Sulfurovum sp.]
MGGFEAEGEGGYWESDQVAKLMANNNTNSQNIHGIRPTIQKDNGIYSIKAHAKVNIFLKITGHKEDYHTLLSRFMQVQDLYDTITFVPFECDSFTIEGCGDIPLKSNTIYKAYQALNDHTGDLDILEFFYKHKVIVTKRIPSQAGLGGGSSDAAAFMLLVKDVCNLMIPTEELAKLGSTIGADVAFFIYNYPSANVSGFGEKVQLFNENPLALELFTPNIGCNTALVYKTFKENLLEDVTACSFFGWDDIDSRTLLEEKSDPIELNDLFKAACIAYPELREVAKEGKGKWFFSGSGSTFFRLKS